MRDKQRVDQESALKAGEDELLRLQTAAFRRQIPLMYLVLAANVAGVAATHQSIAPDWLVLWIPAILVSISMIRMMIWWRTRNREMTTQRARTLLRSTRIFAGILGIAFVGWALALAPYGDAFQQMHVALFMGLTAFVCALCLLHARAIAFQLLAIEIIPFCVYYAWSGNPVLIASSFNVALVAAAVLFVQNRYSQDFRSLAQSRAEARRLHEEMERIAETDSLTQLANRRRFFRALGNGVVQAEHEGRRLSLALIDLDGFKQVNDIHGHRAGDRILRTVAERLRLTVDDGSLIARLGGDEFGIIFSREMSGAELRAAGLAICLAMREPFPLREGNAQLAASVGIASVPESAHSAEELYECADYALYRAKHEAPGTTQLFSATHSSNIKRMSLIEQSLRAPEVGEQLSLVFQPIFDLKRNRIVALEALARWHHPELGPVAPDVFIRAAERSGTISRLSQLLFEQALDITAEWPDDILLSFNLSAHDLLTGSSVTELVRLARSRKANPSLIQLEVTETALITEFEKAQRSLSQLKAAGFQIALDDFGVGYSSLSYLQKLAIDRIKIDKSFIKTLEGDGSARNIVRTIVDLSHSMGIDCIIEGIESEQQLAAVHRIGCGYGQGYYFGLPVDVEELSGLLDGRRRRSA